MANLLDSAKPSGPVKSGKFTITVDRNLCIGAATCVALAPQVFVLDGEAKAIILDTAPSTPENVLFDAAKGCPTAAIFIHDESGNKVAP